MNIYVSNLSFKVQDGDLQRIFEAYGEVSSAKVITDRNTGRSRGFGFVEMVNDEDAQQAIQELNGKEVEGRQLGVSEARPQTERRDFGGGGNGGNRGGGNFRKY